MRSLLTFLGTRPEIVKLSPVLPLLDARLAHTIVHSGQHYSYEMDAQFFDELGLRRPDHSLAVGSASHGEQTARMLARLEPVIAERRPDAVLVQGDTNTTLAGALCAAKLGIPVVHLEAGARAFDRYMPEELNRIVVDHVSSLLLAADDVAATNLRAEGLARERIRIIGSTAIDAVRQVLDRLDGSAILDRLGLVPGGYVAVTAHRARNTAPDVLPGLLAALGEIATRHPVVFPLHPRTRGAMADQGLTMPAGVLVTEPLGLSRHAAAGPRRPGAAHRLGRPAGGIGGARHPDADPPLRDRVAVPGHRRGAQAGRQHPGVDWRRRRALAERRRPGRDPRHPGADHAGRQRRRRRCDDRARLMRLSLVLPCYNEEPNVRALEARLRPVLDGLARRYDAIEVVLVDDGSRDGTWAAMQELTASSTGAIRFRAEKHPTNLGLGAAMRTGLTAATGDVIVTTDSDATYRFEEIPALLDVLTAGRRSRSPRRRTTRSGAVDNVPAYRLFFSRGASFLYRLLVQWNLYTWTALFRAYRRDGGPHGAVCLDGVPRRHRNPGQRHRRRLPRRRVPDRAALARPRCVESENRPHRAGAPRLPGLGVEAPAVRRSSRRYPGHAAVRLPPA